MLLGRSRMAECQFSDRYLAAALEKVDKGVNGLLS